MAKRFTDTEKWKKPFLKALPAKYKLLWFYIVDDCDHAGIWQVDIDVASLRIGEELFNDEAIKFFSDKILVFDGGNKWFIPSFIEFQYPSGLNPQNNAHTGIIKILEKYKLLKTENEPLISPSQGAQDKGMVKDKEMVMVKEERPAPKKEDVERVFLQQGGTVEMATQFYNSCEATSWRRNGQPISNFAPLVSNYIINWKKNNYGTAKSFTGNNGGKVSTMDALRGLK